MDQQPISFWVAARRCQMQRSSVRRLVQRTGLFFFKAVGFLCLLALSTSAANAATLTVTTAANEAYNGGSLASETADGTGLSLLEAIGVAASGDTIQFAPSLSGVAIVNNSSYSLGKSLTINGDINGDGIPDITLNANNYGSNFISVTGGVNVRLQGLTITGVNGGVPIAISNSSFTLINSVVTNNSGTYGGIYASNSDLNFMGDRIENNPAAGTTIDTTGGTLTMTDTSVTGNQAANTVQLANPTSAVITRSTIAHNNYVGLITTGSLTIDRSVLTGNGNTELKLSANSVVTIRDSIIAGTGTPIAAVTTPYSLTFENSNVVSSSPAVTYSGPAPTVEPDLSLIFQTVAGGGGGLSDATAVSGGIFNVALPNENGPASGLGAVPPPPVPVPATSWLGLLLLVLFLGVVAVTPLGRKPERIHRGNG